MTALHQVPDIAHSFEKEDIMSAYFVLSEIFVNYLVDNDGGDEWKEKVQLCWMMVSEMLKERIPEA